MRTSHTAKPATAPHGEPASNVERFAGKLNSYNTGNQTRLQDLKPKTANLQMTVKQAAMLMNVSERTIYMARKIERLRPDLGDAVMADTMSLNAAYIVATGKQKKGTRDRLLSAWNSATDDDRAWLLSQVAEVSA